MTDARCPGCHSVEPNAEGVVARGISRRSMVRATGAAGALGLAASVADSPLSRLLFDAPGLASAAASAAGDVLVVLSLRGGFDGLSAVVPRADADYVRLRPSVGIPTGHLLAGDNRFGLHPALAPLVPFWQSGTFGAVHAVGQVEPSRSHFSAMAELHRAAPGSSLRTGWLDRMLGVSPATSVFRATQIGQIGLLASLTGPNPELVMSSIADFTLNGAWNATEEKRWRTALSAMHRGAPATIAGPAGNALGAVATTAVLKTAGYTPAHGAIYPTGELGESMRDLAQLIKSGVGLRIACLDFGEWDFHAEMGTVDSGRQRDKLAELAAAMAAFATDLGSALMANVVVATLSEFGRRVAENGSGGTDHGLGNAVLLLGGGVVGGQVHGRWPGLATEALADGDLAVTTDYRLILREILTERCLVSAPDTVFPGLTGTSLGVTRPRT
ncbi:MAG: DUF1501 domain-containing protein [Kineosporiaceae bacterium]|nr:DUF1501 domain-containing protein [Kineosporiaceae bacterium]MBK7622319.1 DUF1501 domain-containing protein [Kineosporiaceae bacterium]MBK8074647.1 DUF1501 domain-containing protein [Kineosporiaceae bacterium]